MQEQLPNGCYLYNYQTVRNAFCPFQLNKLGAAEWFVVHDAHWIGLWKDIQVLQVSGENINVNVL